MAIFTGRGEGMRLVNVPGCGQIPLDLRGPRRSLQALADTEGDAFGGIALPGPFSGRTAYFQAIDLGTCETTNLVAVAVE